MYKHLTVQITQSSKIKQHSKVPCMVRYI